MSRPTGSPVIPRHLWLQPDWQAQGLTHLWAPAPGLSPSYAPLLIPQRPRPNLDSQLLNICQHLTAAFWNTALEVNSKDTLGLQKDEQMGPRV